MSTTHRGGVRSARINGVGSEARRMMPVVGKKAGVSSTLRYSRCTGSMSTTHPGGVRSARINGVGSEARRMRCQR